MFSKQYLLIKVYVNTNVYKKTICRVELSKAVNNILYVSRLVDTMICGYLLSEKNLWLIVMSSDNT